MLTPQEINDKGFDSVMLNGYDKGDVDDFLETVSADYNALYKENAILKGKLKVLVEKVEEYRSTEDAMRMALLTAQRMGEEITTEANRTKAEMLQNTEVEIKAKLSDTAQRVTDEETRLALAAKETAKFIELSQAIMRKHSEFLDKLEAARRAVKPKGGPRAAQDGVKASRGAKGGSGRAGQGKGAPPPMKQAPMPPPAPAPAAPPAPALQPDFDSQATKPIAPISASEIEIDDIASQIGSAVEKIADDEVVAPAPPSEISAPLADDSPSLFEDDDGSVKLYSPDDDDDESESAETSPRPKFDFDDLKFGANFDSDD